MEEDEELTEGDEGDVTEEDMTSDTGEEAEFKPEKIQCEEDDEFVKLFDSLMTSESLTTAANKNTDLNIPMNLKAKVEDSQEKVEGKIVFSLITRKGNKTNAKGSIHDALKCRTLMCRTLMCRTLMWARHNRFKPFFQHYMFRKIRALLLV